jgi:hypothetical protein
MNGNMLSMLNVNQKSLFPFFYFSLVFVCKVLLYIIELVLVLDMHELYATGHHATNDQSILAAYVISLLRWNAKLYLLTKHKSYDSLPHADFSTGVTNRAGTAYPSRAPEFTPVFCGVRVTRSLVFCVCFVDRCLSFCTCSFGHCVVCSSSIYGFWLPLSYLQALPTAVMGIYVFPLILSRQ